MIDSSEVVRVRITILKIFEEFVEHREQFCSALLQQLLENLEVRTGSDGVTTNNIN